MPIDDNGVGYSDETKEKIATIHEVADWQYAILRKEWAKPRKHREPFYYHIDAYCGTGVNPEDCTESVSLQLLRRLRKEPFPSEVAMIDNGKDKNSGIPNIASMRAMLTVVEREGVQLYGKSNHIVIPQLLQPLRHQPLGLIFLDPNGAGRANTLRRLLPIIANLGQAQRIDLLLHIGTTGIKRARGAGGSCKDYQWTLDNILALSGKNRGFIKRSRCQHGQGWFFILLTNAPAGTFKEWVQKGWHELDTPLGRYLRQIANYTEEEREQLENEQSPVTTQTLFELK